MFYAQGIFIGIKKKWKINIAYFLTHSTIRADILFKLIKEIIEKSTKSGLNITIKPSKIFLFYDPPHLSKNIRNNMKNQILNLNGNDIK